MLWDCSVLRVPSPSHQAQHPCFPLFPRKGVGTWGSGRGNDLPTNTYFCSSCSFKWQHYVFCIMKFFYSSNFFVWVSSHVAQDFNRENFTGNFCVIHNNSKIREIKERHQGTRMRTSHYKKNKIPETVVRMTHSNKLPWHLCSLVCLFSFLDIQSDAQAEPVQCQARENPSLLIGRKNQYVWSDWSIQVTRCSLLSQQKEDRNKKTITLSGHWKTGLIWA